MFKRSVKGSYSDTEKFLKNLSKNELAKTEIDIVNRYADKLMSALAAATPKDSGLTASSWTYSVKKDKFGKVTLQVFNDNVNDGLCIAILLQYGHGTNGGGYVPGIDYINPATKPIFDKIEEAFWKEVTA